MVQPVSFPAKFRGSCPMCRSVILPSYERGHGHMVAWIPGVGLRDPRRLVHVGCAQTYLDQKDKTA